MTQEEVCRAVKALVPTAGICVLRCGPALAGETQVVLEGQCFGIKFVGAETVPTAEQILAKHAELGALTTPDVLGFKAWLKANMSLALKKKVHAQYPGLFHALDLADWAMVEDYLSDAKTNAVLTLTVNQWNALRTAALTTYKLPLTLPAAS